MHLKSITVDLGDRSYPILIGKGLLPHTGNYMEDLLTSRKAVILTVPGVEVMYSPAVRESLAKCGIASEVVRVPDREEAKTLATYTTVVKKLVAMNAGKDTLIVSLGGGCVGDLAGFVAATYMRGIPIIHIPTTLLAQVDSSIGGKAAINLPEAKNLLGAFHQPSLVLSDIGTLATLPQREMGSGISELIKYGAILDLDLLGFLEKERQLLLMINGEAVIHAISRAAELKASIVSQDERESGDLRTLLNFGHTLGHAIESAMKYHGFSHGEAVGVGMVGETSLAVELDLATRDELERLKALIGSYGLPTSLRGVEPSLILELMANDKKIRAGKWRFALPNGLGNGVVVSDPPREKVVSAIRGVVGY
ncbi:MAG: 3-dehydroquinate synthase [Candidatus Methanomethylicus sp.]|nr:3-dehydroquinate synthase [Candidatus Methanomethylicus sp.]